MTFKTKIATALLGTTGLFAAGGAAAQDVTVGYFLEWPMPFQFAKVQGMYDEALGTTVNWRTFDTGTALSAAMASGDVQLGVSQGSPPFVVATSAGQDLQAVDIAVMYFENGDCVVREELEIDSSNAGDLAGTSVAVPLGTAAHYGFIQQMTHFGVDVATMDVVNMAPPAGAAALAQGSVDMACGWGGGLQRMQEHGNVLLTVAEKEELGIVGFDVTSTTATFAAEYPDLVAAFLEVTAEANAMWTSGENTDEMLAVIAQDAGMDVEGAQTTLDKLVFLTPEEQLGERWFGGGVQDFLKGVADTFAEAGSIDAAKDDYAENVNTGPLEQVVGQ